MQHCNQENAKRRELTNTRWEPGIKGEGSGKFKPPCPPPPNSDISGCATVWSHIFMTGLTTMELHLQWLIGLLVWDQTFANGRFWE